MIFFYLVALGVFPIQSSHADQLNYQTEIQKYNLVLEDRALATANSCVRLPSEIPDSQLTPEFRAGAYVAALTCCNKSLGSDPSPGGRFALKKCRQSVLARIRYAHGKAIVAAIRRGYGQGLVPSVRATLSRSGGVACAIEARTSAGRHWASHAAYHVPEGMDPFSSKRPANRRLEVWGEDVSQELPRISDPYAARGTAAQRIYSCCDRSGSHPQMCAEVAGDLYSEWAFQAESDEINRQADAATARELGARSRLTH